MNIYLLDNENNIKEEINIIRPKNYNQLLKQIEQKFKNISEYYELLILNNENKEIKINNEENYKLIKDILFIRELDKDVLDKSLFEINFYKLSESKKEILELKYNCNICSMMIKNEKPYLCYKCQNIFHENCLKEWDKQCFLQNKTLICPNCRNELPIENWNKKLDYEENRIFNAKLIDKINEYKMENKMITNMNKIKEKQINELNNNIITQNELIKHYENYINKTIKVFKNILKDMSFIHDILKIENKNKLNNLNINN